HRYIPHLSNHEWDRYQLYQPAGQPAHFASHKLEQPLCPGVGFSQPAPSDVYAQWSESDPESAVNSRLRSEHYPNVQPVLQRHLAHETDFHSDLRDVLHRGDAAVRDQWKTGRAHRPVRQADCVDGLPGAKAKGSVGRAGLQSDGRVRNRAQHDSLAEVSLRSVLRRVESSGRGGMESTL